MIYKSDLTTAAGRVLDTALLAARAEVVDDFALLADVPEAFPFDPADCHHIHRTHTMRLDGGRYAYALTYIARGQRPTDARVVVEQAFGFTTSIDDARRAALFAHALVMCRSDGLNGVAVVVGVTFAALTAWLVVLGVHPILLAVTGSMAFAGLSNLFGWLSRRLGKPAREGRQAVRDAALYEMPNPAFPGR